VSRQLKTFDELKKEMGGDEIQPSVYDYCTKTTQAGKPEEDWETLRKPPSHKAVV